MNGGRRGGSHRKRLIRAVCILGLLGGSIAVIDGFWGADAVEAQATGGLSVRLPESPGTLENDPFAVLDAVEQQMAATETAPDSNPLLQAVVVLPEARDLRSDDTGCAASYVVEGAAEEVLGALSEAMEQRGWSPMPLGDVPGTAFMDGEGAYESLIATATQIGDSVSIVFRAVEL